MPHYHLVTAISDIFKDELFSEFYCNYPPMVFSLSPSLMLVSMLVNDMCNYVFVPIYAHTRVWVDMHMPWHRCEGQRSLLNLYFPIATLGLQMIVSGFDVEFVWVLWILTSVWMTDTLPPHSIVFFFIWGKTKEANQWYQELPPSSSLDTFECTVSLIFLSSNKSHISCLSLSIKCSLFHPTVL